mmetsp:Transcript_74068/g.207925  ORF Transcript_74068/g.207925 Transcript_74068/m.207925 type:complete len:227 (-) Transcript_74068:272-952(-)
MRSVPTAGERDGERNLARPIRFSERLRPPSPGERTRARECGQELRRAEPHNRLAKRITPPQAPPWPRALLASPAGTWALRPNPPGCRPPGSPAPPPSRRPRCSRPRPPRSSPWPKAPRRPRPARRPPPPPRAWRARRAPPTPRSCSLRRPRPVATCRDRRRPAGRRALPTTSASARKAPQRPCESCGRACPLRRRAPLRSRRRRSKPTDRTGSTSRRALQPPRRSR